MTVKPLRVLLVGEVMDIVKNCVRSRGGPTVAVAVETAWVVLGFDEGVELELVRGAATESVARKRSVKSIARV